MRIKNYIVYGGNNLNDPPRETDGFPVVARELFVKWQKTVTWNSSEEVCFIEVPVSPDYRLLIRPFRDETRYSRLVYFFVGFLIGKADYQSMGEYYAVNKGILSLTLNDILGAELKPITVTKCRCPKTAIWKPFEELTGTQAVETDDDLFRARYEEFCFSVSVNNIDDWFERLAVAVNLTRCYPEINYSISKRVLTPQVKPMKQDESVKEDDVRPCASTEKKGYFGVNVLCLLFLLATGGFVWSYLSYVSCGRVINGLKQRIAYLEREKQDSETTHKESYAVLQAKEKECEQIKEKVCSLEQEVKSLKSTLKKAQEQYKESHAVLQAKEKECKQIKDESKGLRGRIRVLEDENERYRKRAEGQKTSSVYTHQ